MANYGFPADNYTPHGYLANPYAFARSWTDGEGGCLRSSREYVGLGWQLPWSLRAQASAELVVGLESDGRQLISRAAFSSTGLGSPHHTSRLLVYRWEALGLAWDASFTLIDADRLGLHLVWSPLPAAGAPEPMTSPGVRLTIGLLGWRQSTADAPAPATIVDGGSVSLGDRFGRVQLLVSDAWVRPADDDGAMLRLRPPDPVPAAWLTDGAGQAAVAATLDIPAGGAGVVSAVARRVRPGQPPAETPAVANTVGQALAGARAADAHFWSHAARLVGDWPDSWRRGWVYDLETTRMCIYPPGGVFTDVWPAWMIQWPRAVIAEGALDLVRLAYADPQLALRAAMSLFRDATADNVPCIFQHGEPNMVAADGSVCGTSPAWCVPFYNLERLYSLTHDRAWLAAIYPYLARYLEWWLRERTDADGWAVYKCTWEAGEDDTPRLDPERRGDNVVSAFVRPVELQATMALSASVLARFAETLGDAEAASRWRTVEAAFAARTRELWDAAEGRFRDWDARADRFLAPSAETNYWGIDPCRYSALAFTPVLAGLADAAQQDALRRELRHYGGPPWTLWASWSLVVLEAATLLGERAFAGEVAAGIVSRVYTELDTREIASPKHPTPGVAREFWPLDLDDWASCEGYGWGANTATLLMRQVFGFLEGPVEDASQAESAGSSWCVGRLRFSLAPSLPPAFLVPGREYRIANLPYRGATLALGYRVSGPVAPGGPANLTLLVSAELPTVCTVTDERGQQTSGGQPRTVHELPALNGALYDVELTAPGRPAGS